MRISLQRLQALIIHRPTHGEVIQALKILAADADQLMHRIIEVTTDTVPRTLSLRLNYQDPLTSDIG